MDNLYLFLAVTIVFLNLWLKLPQKIYKGIFKMLLSKRMIKSMYKMRLLAIHITVVCVLFIPFVADVYFHFQDE